MWEGVWTKRTFTECVHHVPALNVWSPKLYQDRVESVWIVLGPICGLCVIMFIASLGMPPQDGSRLWVVLTSVVCGTLSALLFFNKSLLLSMFWLWWKVTHKPLSWLGFGATTQTTRYRVEEHRIPLQISLSTEPQPILRSAPNMLREVIELVQIAPSQEAAKALVQLAAPQYPQDVTLRLSASTCAVELSCDPDQRDCWAMELRDLEDRERFCVLLSPGSLTTEELDASQVVVLEKFGIQMEPEALESFLSEMIHLLQLQGVRLPRALQSMQKEAV